MNKLESTEVDSIAEACIHAYYKLPKTGKPVEQEWTVLSSIVKYKNSKDIEVVCLGTGSKCVGASKMSSGGDILNDSHAEVITRRAFMVYLYENIEKAIDNKNSIFYISQGKLILQEELSFIFYSSQLPCGDASILPKSDNEMIGKVLTGLKRKNEEISNCNLEQLTKSDNDIHRTGAKCLPESQQDLKGSGKDYHVLGQVRTKPGRGDRTLSVSCSDKIARWIHVGIHGALLDLLLKEPIFIKHFIFGANMPFSEESIKRAFLDRCIKSNLKDSLQSELHVNIPEFYQCNINFPNVKNEHSLRPAPGSIIWINTHDPVLEVAVLGRKLGATKKKGNSSSTLCISKLMLMKRFLTVIKKNHDIKKSIPSDRDIEKVPYNYLKGLSQRYNSNWSKVKNVFFQTWTIKPDMWNFYVNS